MSNKLTDGYHRLKEQFEGKHSQAYLCPAGIVTIAIGHVVLPTEAQKMLGCSIAEAKRQILKDKSLWIKTAPKLTDAEIYSISDSDDKWACDKVDKRLKAWGATVNDDEYSLLVDLVINGGPTFLDGGIKTALQAKKNLDAILFAPKFANAVVPGKGPKPVPVTGLTFRRYSFVWLALTGEAWRIGSEGSTDKDWAEVNLFLAKLTALLRIKGAKNPLPYSCNRRENQRA